MNNLVVSISSIMLISLLGCRSARHIDASAEIDDVHIAVGTFVASDVSSDAVRSFATATYRIDKVIKGSFQEHDHIMIPFHHGSWDDESFISPALLVLFPVYDAQEWQEAPEQLQQELSDTLSLIFEPPGGDAYRGIFEVDSIHFSSVEDLLHAMPEIIATPISSQLPLSTAAVFAREFLEASLPGTSDHQYTWVNDGHARYSHGWRFRFKAVPDFLGGYQIIIVGDDGKQKW